MRNRKFLGIVVGWWLVAFAPGVASEGFQYEEGTHYVTLNIPVKTRDPNLVEVTEYFSYACPHCYQFEPLVNQWKSGLAADVVFNRTPAIFSSQYEFFAQVYYTAEALNVLDLIHAPLFLAIHGERRRLTDKNSMAMFFSEHGVDPQEFAKTYESFGVRASRQQAEARGRAYRSKGVPAIIVNGKYRIEGSMAGDNASMLAIAGFLVERERRLLQEGQAKN